VRALHLHGSGAVNIPGRLRFDQACRFCLYNLVAKYIPRRDWLWMWRSWRTSRYGWLARYHENTWFQYFLPKNATVIAHTQPVLDQCFEPALGAENSH
jgi:hypothetical protein